MTESIKSPHSNDRGANFYCRICSSRILPGNRDSCGSKIYCKHQSLTYRMRPGQKQSNGSQLQATKKFNPIGSDLRAIRNYQTARNSKPQRKSMDLELQAIAIYQFNTARCEVGGARDRTSGVFSYGLIGGACTNIFDNKKLYAL
jgi:hypothetical protein